jgi:hypothetical protein
MSDLFFALVLSERVVRTFPWGGQGRGQVTAFRRCRSKLRPWVARITGLDATYGFERDFVTPFRDYRNASRSGKGTVLCFFLRPGVYEVKEIVSAKYHVRRFCTVLDDGSARDTYPEELELLFGRRVETWVKGKN